MKRLIVATISGLLFGFVCFGLASSGPEPLPWMIGVQIILSRVLMGFALGITRYDFGHWTIRGLVFGLLFSLPLGFGGMIAETPEFTPMMMFISTVFMGMIYGFLTEVIITVIFKAKI